MITLSNQCLTWDDQVIARADDRFKVKNLVWYEIFHWRFYKFIFLKLYSFTLLLLRLQNVNGAMHLLSNSKIFKVHSLRILQYWKWEQLFEGFLAIYCQGGVLARCSKQIWISIRRNIVVNKSKRGACVKIERGREKQRFFSSKQLLTTSKCFELLVVKNLRSLSVLVEKWIVCYGLRNKTSSH